MVFWSKRWQQKDIFKLTDLQKTDRAEIDQLTIPNNKLPCSCPSSHLPNVQSDIKFKLLLEILNKVSFSQCLIFSNYSVRAESICEKLEANGWPVMFMAGIMDQRDRLRALQSLKQFSCRVLITTDLSARGIDAANVNLGKNKFWQVYTILDSFRLV